MKKEEKSQINNLTFHHKTLKREETKPKINRWKKVIKTREKLMKQRLKKQKPVLYKYQQNWHIFRLIIQEEKKKKPKLLESEMKEDITTDLEIKRL